MKCDSPGNWLQTSRWSRGYMYVFASYTYRTYIGTSSGKRKVDWDRRMDRTMDEKRKVRWRLDGYLQTENMEEKPRVLASWRPPWKTEGWGEKKQKRRLLMIESEEETEKKYPNNHDRKRTQIPKGRVRSAARFSFFPAAFQTTSHEARCSRSCLLYAVICSGNGHKVQLTKSTNEAHLSPLCEIFAGRSKILKMRHSAKQHYVYLAFLHSAHSSKQHTNTATKESSWIQSDGLIVTVVNNATALRLAEKNLFCRKKKELCFFFLCS